MRDDTASRQVAEYDESEYKIREYSDALSRAKENIEFINACVENSFELFDSGECDDGLSSLDECRSDTAERSF